MILCIKKDKEEGGRDEGRQLERKTDRKTEI